MYRAISDPSYPIKHEHSESWHVSLSTSRYVMLLSNIPKTAGSRFSRKESDRKVLVPRLNKTGIFHISFSIPPVYSILKFVLVSFPVFFSIPPQGTILYLKLWQISSEAGKVQRFSNDQNLNQTNHIWPIITNANNPTNQPIRTRRKSFNRRQARENV